ncbi:hypothetical protein [Moorena sp. SIO4G3]|uniref:hypothetical protein n=1 Tax=Moorena sp. SIO4G3 TaxID=2607821 RepID=UPI00142BC164|nr:hypothetical protein [Moorena sp. SIO4G3]NEO81927.1 hypothetical protein [Moorena sp. SIO4G3]
MNNKKCNLRQLIKTLCVVVILAFGLLGLGDLAQGQELVVNTEGYCRLTKEVKYC